MQWTLEKDAEEYQEGVEDQNDLRNAEDLKEKMMTNFCCDDEPRQDVEDMPTPIGFPRPLAPRGWIPATQDWIFKDKSDDAEKPHEGFRKDGKTWVLDGGVAKGFRVEIVGGS